MSISAMGLAQAQESVLYDIDFSAPTHLLNASPTVGAAPDKISSIRAGSPTVVSSFGELTDRPLLFTGGSPSYDQIELNGDHPIETCRLEFDLFTENLKGSAKSFTVLFDTPTVRVFSLEGATSRIQGSYATWEEGRRLRCSLFADFINNLWEARVDGELVFSVPINATGLSTIRFSMGSLGGNPAPTVKAAVDNIRVLVTRPIIPDVPEDFSATGGAGATAISLSWTSVPEATFYRIYRNAIPSFPGATLIGTTAQHQYSDMNASPGFTYYYWITSVKGAYSSPFGPSAATRIDLLPPPSLTVSGPERSDGILLSWPAPPLATHYRIYRGQSDSFTSSTLLATTNVLTYMDTTTPPGVHSYYWIESRVGSATSATQVAGNGVRGLAMVAGLEASLHVHSNRIDLQWKTVPGATAYRIFRGESEEFTKSAFLGVASGTEYSDVTAENDLVYHYWVAPLSMELEGAAGLPARGIASVFQPDLWLEGNSMQQFGRGVTVERGGNGSELIETRRNRLPISVKLWIGKLGERGGGVTVGGTRGNGHFIVTYHRDGNITAEMASGRLEMDTDSPSGPVTILIQPSRRIRTMLGSRSYQLVCRGTSSTTPSTEDQVVMKAVSLPKPSRKPVRRHLTNHHRPRAFGGKGAEGMKKGSPSNSSQ